VRTDAAARPSSVMMNRNRRWYWHSGPGTCCPEPLAAAIAEDAPGVKGSALLVTRTGAAIEG
jgi:hypothetical protein